ncbi:MAG TPA: DUF58 domain-containing protein [Fibrobacteria bacterium]|nr:DUF58 domain-containing protein [Fibrobacteria bacterium]
MTLWHRTSWTLRWVARTWPRGTEGRDPFTWIWKAYRERTTPGGKVLCGIWFLLLPVSILSRGYLGGFALALLSALLATSWFLTLSPSRVPATAILPAAMREGETISVQVVLGSGGDPLPRGVGAWIFRTGDRLMAVGDGASPHPSGGRTVDVPLRALHRGIQSLEGPTVLRSDPLGLFRSRSLLQSPARIAILPRPCEVVSMDGLFRGPGGRSFAEALDAGMRGEEEFIGIRPWREGDALRALHHRGWARTGHPMVRETEAPAGGGIVVAFHSGCSSWARRSLMDPAISLASGVAAFLCVRNALAGFFLDDAWVPLTARDPLLSVGTALAALPASGGWGRHRGRRPAATIPVVDVPLVLIAYSDDLQQPVGTTTPGRILWVDWGEGRIPDALVRIGPDRILTGAVRL